MAGDICGHLGTSGVILEFPGMFRDVLGRPWTSGVFQGQTGSSDDEWGLQKCTLEQLVELSVT